jgi:hypothetical protein
MKQLTKEQQEHAVELIEKFISKKNLITTSNLLSQSLSPIA